MHRESVLILWAGVRVRDTVQEEIVFMGTTKNDWLLSDSLVRSRLKSPPLIEEAQKRQKGKPFRLEEGFPLDWVGWQDTNCYGTNS